jgi:peptide-methionine (S)-S-oxide reductase
MEPPFEKLAGVISVTSGYCGGPEKNPTYSDVSAGKTGHLESIQVVFDPKQIPYKRLLDVFWRNIDPTQGDGQFCDHGAQYRSAIFYHDENQRRLAAESREAIESTKRLKAPIVTKIILYRAFYPAEDYHQDYYKKKPEHYHEYRSGCGRDARLKALWGDEAGGLKTPTRGG